MKQLLLSILRKYFDWAVLYQKLSPWKAGRLLQIILPQQTTKITKILPIVYTLIYQIA